MEVSPESLPHASVYKLMTGAIVPRPIGWISTLSADGRPNLAPFSFFNAVCSKPATVVFCPLVRGTDGGTKDTLHNVRATGEFVVNIVTEELASSMNLSSIEAPSDFNEFEFAGLTAEASKTVRAPRVAESPIHFECRLRQIVEISDQPGGGSLVIGTVVHIHVDERVLLGSDKIDLTALKPIGRLAGGLYTRVTDLFELERPKSMIPVREEKP